MEHFSFHFLNGSSIKATTGEDGITVNILQNDEEPLMGTFTDFQNFLKRDNKWYTCHHHKGYKWSYTPL